MTNRRMHRKCERERDMDINLSSVASVHFVVGPSLATVRSPMVEEERTTEHTEITEGDR